MKKIYFIPIIFASILVIIILVIIIGFQVLNLLNQSNENQKSLISAPLEAAAQSNLVTQTNNEGPVEIAVTPKNLSAQEWTFEIALNTHSTNIGEDLIKVSVLTDEKGNEYRPIEWQGDPPGGHHRNGILKFEPISPRPTSITLKIRQVGGIAERNFTWQLK